MQASNVELEQHLEEWIERDPALLQAGLVIVGRQVYTAGGPLDLLALDFQGCWNVIEIKRGKVHRETVAQAIDYASCIREMDAEELRNKVGAYLKDHPVGGLTTLDAVLEQRGVDLDDEEERDVAITVVGTSQDAGLERIVNFLGERGNFHFSVVSFEVFALPSGEQALVRELTESDEEPGTALRRTSNKRPTPNREQFLQLAESNGCGDAIRQFIEGAERAGLYPRLYPRSVMLTPPTNKTRGLLGTNVNPDRDGNLRVWNVPETFTEFYDIPESRYEEAMGVGNDWLAVPQKEVASFMGRLAKLVREAGENSADE